MAESRKHKMLKQKGEKMKDVFVERCNNQELGVVAVNPRYKEAAINAMMAMPFIDHVQTYIGCTKMHITFSPLTEDRDVEQLRETLERIVQPGD